MANYRTKKPKSPKKEIPMPKTPSTRAQTTKDLLKKVKSKKGKK
jgi:hypothetical protein